ncbi:twin-arginine translocase TatA/TatE family subunit [Paracoccus tibetensis]|uniref:Sec-independent protein translocase protein TatA n=1 Tax=Paracoccus tibetensis TaxID=336292 RepID=A0A1G5DIL3_9RHOB|nr:twin-arginine translocase TatA/TatE family subunit [Paracoccus tibetensis]SCY14553.1 sec-independent protein translocase protein TatA [Paracoccus tibetensis]
MLNNIGLPGLLLIAVVVLVLFGRGKISSLMGEVGKGITAFKRGVKDGSEEVETATDDLRDPALRRDLPGERARDVTPTPKPQSTTTTSTDHR